jgi:[ribosomal protein S5]-alanine N-acetyltransferase
MHLKPIKIDEDKTDELYADADCQEIFKSYPDYYYKVGYNPPWIGYFVIRDEKVVGVCGFVGSPNTGRIEIAYGTFKKNEGQGIASFACREMIAVVKKTDPGLIITAKTAPEENASVAILRRNGFEFAGIVQDDGIGDAWEWVK